MPIKMDLTLKFSIQKVYATSKIVNNEKNQFYKQLYRIQPNNIKKYFDK